MHFPEYILAMSVHFCKVWVFFVNHCDLERFYSPVRLWLLSSLFVLTNKRVVFVFYPFLLHVKHSPPVCVQVALLSNLLLHNILHLYGWVKLNFLVEKCYTSNQADFIFEHAPR